MNGKDDYEVGYGKPPKQHRFQKGRSGNPGGGSKKKATAIDLAEVLDAPVEVNQRGKRATMEPMKIALLAQVKKAQAGDLRALIHALEKMVKHGVFGTGHKRRAGGVVTLPSTMPFAMARIMAHRFGQPPWTKRQIETGRADYVARRSEAQAREDQAIGYPDL